MKTLFALTIATLFTFGCRYHAGGQPEDIKNMHFSSLMLYTEKSKEISIDSSFSLQKMTPIVFEKKGGLYLDQQKFEEPKEPFFSYNYFVSLKNQTGPDILAKRTLVFRDEQGNKYENQIGMPARVVHSVIGQPEINEYSLTVSYELEAVDDGFDLCTSIFQIGFANVYNKCTTLNRSNTIGKIVLNRAELASKLVEEKQLVVSHTIIKKYKLSNFPNQNAVIGTKYIADLKTLFGNE